MNRKELCRLIQDEHHLNVKDIMRLCGLGQNYLYYGPEEVPNVIHDIILAAIDLRHEQKMAELDFTYWAQRERYASHVCASQFNRKPRKLSQEERVKRYIDKVESYSRRYKTLNEDEYRLDNISELSRYNDRDYVNKYYTV